MLYIKRAHGSASFLGAWYLDKSAPWRLVLSSARLEKTLPHHTSCCQVPILTRILGMTRPNPSNSYSSRKDIHCNRISAIISQVTILVLTLAKYKIAVQHGWGKVPIMMLVVRDGTVAFFVLLSESFDINLVCILTHKWASVITTMTVVATSMQAEYAPIGNSCATLLSQLHCWKVNTSSSWFLSVVACSVS